MIFYLFFYFKFIFLGIKESIPNFIVPSKKYLWGIAKATIAYFSSVWPFYEFHIFYPFKDYQMYSCILVVKTPQVLTKDLQSFSARELGEAKGI